MRQISLKRHPLVKSYNIMLKMLTSICPFCSSSKYYPVLTKFGSHHRETSLNLGKWGPTVREFQQHIIHITNRSCIPLPKMTALLLCDCLGNDCSTYVNVWLTESGCSAPENTPRSLNFCMCFSTHFFLFFNFVTIHLLPHIYTRLIYFSNLFDRLFMYFHALL